MSLAFVANTSPPLKRQREQVGTAMEGPMARLLFPADAGERESAPVELSTAGLFSMQTQQVLDRSNEGQLARELQAQGILCGTMAPCSSGRAYITLESTVFTWEPVLSPLAAPLEAPSMDHSILIQDTNGAPYLDGSRGRTVAVLSLGASGRIVVVLDRGHVLLRNTASGYGAHDYTVTLEADKDERVTAASVSVVNDNPREGYWVLVGTSLGRVHRLGPLMAETADRAPEITPLGPGTHKGWGLPFFGRSEELGPPNLVSLVVDGDWVVAIGQREAAAYRLQEPSPRRNLPSLGPDSVTLGGGLLAPGVLLRLSYAYASESLSLHVVDYLRMTDPMGHDTLLWTQPNLHIPSLAQARLYLSPANTPYDVLAYVTLPGHDKLDVFVVRARVPVTELRAPLHVCLPQPLLGGQLLGCGFLDYSDALLLFTTKDGGCILRLDAPRLTAPLPLPTTHPDPARVEGVRREAETALARLSQLEREGHGAAAADLVHHELTMGLLSQRVVGESDAALGEALRRIVAQAVERVQGAGAYFGVGAAGDVSKLVTTFLSSKHKDAVGVLQALERVGLFSRLSDGQKTLVTKSLQQCAAMVRLCHLLQDATSSDRGAAPQAFRHVVDEAVRECKAKDPRSTQLPMDYFLIWPSKITERLALIQSIQGRVQATSDRVEVVNCVSQLLCDVLEAASLESTRLRNSHRFRPAPAHGWPAEPPTLALLSQQLSMLRSVKDFQHSLHLDGMRVPELTVRLARAWLGALGRQATPQQRREAVMAVYEYEKAGSAREALRLAREHDALDVLAEIQYAEGKHAQGKYAEGRYGEGRQRGEGSRHSDQLVHDLSQYPAMARHLFRYLYEHRQYHDLLQLGSSSPSAQRELEALLQADKNARRLAWVNEINAQKYTACARTLLELERDTQDSPNLRSLFWSLGRLSVEAATATPPESDDALMTQQPQDSDGFEDVKCDLYEDGLLILAQRLIEWALHVNHGRGFQRVLPPGEIVDMILNITPEQLANVPALPDGRVDSLAQKDAMLSLFRTAMDVMDCLQGRRGLVWGQDEQKGMRDCVTLWYKIVTFRDDWHGVWAADNAFGGQRGKTTLFYKVIKGYYQDRRQPQAYDYPRISEPTDNVLGGVIDMINRTRIKGGTIPPTLEHTLVQHRNEAQMDQLGTDPVWG